MVKFGGSTTGNGQRLAIAAERLLASPGRPVLVVASAPGEFTDELLRVLSDSGVPPGDPGALGPLWRAEQVGAELFASAVRARGGEVRLLQPGSPDWPLVLRSAASGARVDLNETRERFRRLWRSGSPIPSITVMPGFVGVDRAGQPGTLPRGGGDTTAVVAARCLGAAEVVLVKDVPGILPADPRIYPRARPLAELSTADLELLGHGGSPVVALEALRYLGEGLTLRVVGLEAAFAGAGGTVISPESGRTGDERPRSRAAKPGSVASGPPEWAVVTALPAEGPAADPGEEPSTGGRSRRAAGVHAISWIIDAAEADDTVRRLLSSGEFRAASHRPYSRLAGDDGSVPERSENPRGGPPLRAPRRSAGRGPRLE